MRWDLAIEQDVDVGNFWQVFDFGRGDQKDFIIFAEKLVSLLLDLGEALLCLFCVLIGFDETDFVHFNPLIAVLEAWLTGRRPLVSC